MIDNVYQLIAPRTVAIKFEDVDIANKVIVRPRYMAVCHADQRYFQGKRDPEVMRKKLPMALIHECTGEVLADDTHTFNVGDPVVMIPNIPGHGPDGVYENYASGSAFRSSGHDGFMREFVALPADRVVSCAGVEPHVAAITEFVSVTMHGIHRFDIAAHAKRDRIAIIGDGSLAYALACTLSCQYPECEIVVVGHDPEKLSMFSFVAERYLSYEAPADLTFDHAFECAGGEGSTSAIDFVIEHIQPQGTLMLMGVSEHPVPVFTRNVLEKGMTLVGCSRSGRDDFLAAIDVMRDKDIQRRLSQIVHFDGEVNDIKDIKRVFATDLQNPFKTVFKWGL